MHWSHGLQHLRHKRPTFAFALESGYTLGFAQRIAHNGSHGETRGISSMATARSCAASEIATERTAGGSGCTPMACVRFLRRRGPAGLRDLFYFCRNRDLYIRRSWFSACARQGWYHYSRCAPHAAETPGPRLSKRLTCRFLVSPIYICESPRRMQPISASIQIACCWISRGHIACPWLIQA